MTYTIESHASEHVSRDVVHYINRYATKPFTAWREVRELDVDGIARVEMIDGSIRDIMRVS